MRQKQLCILSLQRQFDFLLVEIMTSLGNRIAEFHMDVIADSSRPNPMPCNVDTADICWQIDTTGPLLLTWNNFNPSMDCYLPGKVWDEITYAFMNFIGAIHPTLYNGCNYLSMLELKLNQVSKRGH